MLQLSKERNGRREAGEGQVATAPGQEHGLVVIFRAENAGQRSGWRWAMENVFPVGTSALLPPPTHTSSLVTYFIAICFVGEDWGHNGKPANELKSLLILFLRDSP